MNKSSKKYFFSAVAMMVVLLIGLSNNALAQYKPKDSHKAHVKEETIRRNKNAKRIKKKGNSKYFKKQYYKQQSRYTQNFTGRISLMPQAKDYNEIKQRVDRNPERRNMKMARATKAVQRGNSEMAQKGLGATPVVRPNPKLTYRYSSAAMHKSKGTTAIKREQPSYRTSSRKMQKYSGSIYVQPKAMQKDYNEVKARVEKRPGRTEMKQQANRESNYRAQSSIQQQFKGYVPHVKNELKLSGKYTSKTQNRFAGDLKAKNVKAEAARRKVSANIAASYKGNYPVVSKSGKRAWDKSVSHQQTRYRGELPKHKMAPTSSGLAQQYKGSLKGTDKRGVYQSRKAIAKSYTGYQGELKGNTSARQKSLAQGRSASQHQFQGNIRSSDRRAIMEGRKFISQEHSGYTGSKKSITAQQNKMLMERQSKMAHNDKGNILTINQRAMKQMRGSKQMEFSEHSGRFKTLSEKKNKSLAQRRSQDQHQFQGNIKTYSKEDMQTMRHGKAMEFSEYSGNRKLLSEKKQKGLHEERSIMQHQYQGNLKVLKQKDRKQEQEAKQMEFSEYRGFEKLETAKKKKARLEDLSVNQHQFAGSIKRKTQDDRKLHYEYMSKTSHQYSGEIKLKPLQKWREENRSQTNMMANYKGDIKLPAQKHRELTGEYMSKIAHNYKGDFKTKTKGAKEYYYKELSARNQQMLGNYKLKSPWRHSLEAQYTSARVHNYEGGNKTGFLARWWVKIFEGDDNLRKTDNRIKKAKYDSKESEIWH